MRFSEIWLGYVPKRRQGWLLVPVWWPLYTSVVVIQVLLWLICDGVPLLIREFEHDD